MRVENERTKARVVRYMPFSAVHEGQRGRVQGAYAMYVTVASDCYRKLKFPVFSPDPAPERDSSLHRGSYEISWTLAERLLKG